MNDVIAVATNRPGTGDIGLMQPAILFTGITYIAGGFIFAIARFRANVLARWAAALLALGTLATIAVGLVPQCRTSPPPAAAKLEFAMHRIQT